MPFYVSICSSLTTSAVLHLASCDNRFQAGDSRPAHATASVSQCNESGVASPRIPRNRADRQADESQHSNCMRRRTRHFSPMREIRTAGWLHRRAIRSGCKGRVASMSSSSASSTKRGSRAGCATDALVRVNTNPGIPASSHSHMPP